jgi:hypothetical protein
MMTNEVVRKAVVAGVAVAAFSLSMGLAASVAGSENTVKGTERDSPAGISPVWQSYADMPIKPYGTPGVVNEVNLMVWGRESSRRGGDAYSPAYIGHGSHAPNPYHIEMPYGYLFRVDVPKSYIHVNDRVELEIWDADTYNRLDSPPTWPVPVTPAPCSPQPCTPSPTPVPPTPHPDAYARCADPNRPPPTPPLQGGGETLCSSNSYPGYTYTISDAGMYRGSFTNGVETPRPAFWRADEYRTPYHQPIGGGNVTHATTTTFTLWHFNPRLSGIYGNPSSLSDQPGGNYLASWMIGADTRSDLRWYLPDGTPGDPGTMSADGTINTFSIRLRGDGCSGYKGDDCYEREADGGMSFYLYVKGVAGSSENSYDLRAGPPQVNSCADPNARHCQINNQYYDHFFSGWPDWHDGGARIYAKRALPLNAISAAGYPFILTQVHKNQAGETLGVRHFDQDCNRGCGSPMQYQMQICGCTDLNDPDCWSDIAPGFVGPNDGWVVDPNPDPEPVAIPIEGTAQYELFFGSAGQCPTSHLRIEQNPSYSNDTTTWEVPLFDKRMLWDR